MSTARWRLRHFAPKEIVVNNHEPKKPEHRRATPEPPAAPLKAPWCEPKLAFVEPELRKQGEMTELTGQGFFGTFIP
jgi:hypothetical protein